LLRRWSILRVCFYHRCNEFDQLGTEYFRWLNKTAFGYFFKETVHVFGPKWRHKSQDLVKDTTKRPDITLAIVGQILPYLWTGVVRCSRLSIQHAILSNFANVEVAKYRGPILIQEYIGTFDVSVVNVEVVEDAQGLNG
jgi:hypothetical protein